MPCGRKISTSTNIVKAMTSLRLVRARDAEPGEDEVGSNRFNHAEKQAAEHGARDIADAAKHSRREGFDAGDETHEKVDALRAEHAIDHTGGARQESADAEGEHDDPVNVDAHQAGNLFILRDRSHRFADARALDQPVQAQHQNKCRAEHEYLHDRNVDAAD